MQAAEMMTCVCLCVRTVCVLVFADACAGVLMCGCVLMCMCVCPLRIQAGLVSPKLLLSVVGTFHAETSFPVWTQLATDLADLAGLIESQPFFPAFQRFLGALYAKVVDQVCGCQACCVCCCCVTLGRCCRCCFVHVRAALGGATGFARVEWCNFLSVYLTTVCAGGMGPEAKRWACGRDAAHACAEGSRWH